MITFQFETFADIRAEVEPLLKRHWEEIALNKDSVPLDPDWEKYERINAAGLMHITTARRGGALVGYSAYFVSGNLHYRSLTVAESDIFWLAPEERNGMTGIRLLQAAEEHLKARGVNKIVSKVKLHMDVGHVFTLLGYEPIERVYAKMVS